MVWWEVRLGQPRQILTRLRIVTAGVLAGPTHGGAAQCLEDIFINYSQNNYYNHYYLHVMFTVKQPLQSLLGRDVYTVKL